MISLAYGTSCKGKVSFFVMSRSKRPEKCPTVTAMLLMFKVSRDVATGKQSRPFRTSLLSACSQDEHIGSTKSMN